MNRSLVARVLAGGAAVVLAATLAQPVPAGAGAAPSAPTAVGSVNQVQVTGASTGSTVELVQDGGVVDTGEVGDNGAFVFGNRYGPADDVPAGGGYTVREVGGPESDPVTVLDFDPNDPAAGHPPAGDPLYADQDLAFGAADLGYGYVTMRDGTELAIHAQPPLVVDPLHPLGPYPTLINYSGYTPADPTTTNPEPTLLLARALGYATVGVNMRGTGCSGGSFAFFEELQSTDGYDIVEAVAAQDWSDGIGTFGISYPGISQLFVGQTRPPSLDAMAPLSVIADTARSTLYPGAILNNGFATDWAEERERYAQPAPDGQAWANTRIDNGDTTCADNQLLHSEAPKISELLVQEPLSHPTLADPAFVDSLAPRTFVDQINVPGDNDVEIFLGGAWQDEQTGGHFPTMIEQLASDAPEFRAFLTNGTHVESFGPDILAPMFEFLELYVADQTPQWGAGYAGGPVLSNLLFGDQYALPLDRFNILQTPAQARAIYEAEDAITVLWERGALESDLVLCVADTDPGPSCADRSPIGRYRSTYPSWPPPDALATELFLSPDGRLDPNAPDVADDELRGRSSYNYDGAGVSQQTTFSGGTSDIWRLDADFDWQPVPADESLSFETDPLAEPINVLGSGSVDLWLRSTAPDVDVEVNLIEVRPDGQETYVQSGWLRAGHREEGEASTALAPFHPFTSRADLPEGEFSPMRVELFPVAHVFRPGSRLRLSIEAPGGNRPFWKFNSLDAPGTVNDIAHSIGRPSKVTLSTVPDPGAPAELPPCESLRAQPCRPDPRPEGVTDVVALYERDAGGGGAAPAAVTEDSLGAMHVTWDAPVTDRTLTGYEVRVAPTDETFPVDGSATSFDYPLDDPPPPTTPFTFTVTAQYAEGDSPPSSSSLTVPGAHGFSDVADGAWFERALDWIAGYEIASGFPGGTFGPTRSINRGQMANWLWNMMGRPEGSPDNDFPDVPSDAWYGDALDWVAAEGIAVGYPNGDYGPKDSISRAQLTMWLWRMADEPDAPAHSFGDVPAGIWFEGGLNWLSFHEIASGFPNGRFGPATSVTRAQMANWLFNLADTPAAGVT